MAEIHKRPSGQPEGQPTERRELDLKPVRTMLPKRWIGFLEDVADFQGTTFSTVLHQAIAGFIKDTIVENESGNQEENRRLRTTAALDQSLDVYFDPFSVYGEQHDEEI